MSCAPVLPGSGAEPSGVESVGIRTKTGALGERSEAEGGAWAGNPGSSASLLLAVALAVR